ncbi:MAG: cytochrome c5 family protein, partial [Gammaproteobacteria bacterium]|nr:cytochrome c5 family protein [Gammaproteobacteria bacterium]
MNKLISVISAGILLGLSGTVLADGEKIYKQSCQACHANGVA